MVSLVIENEEGTPIRDLDMGNIERGNSSDIKTFIIRNNETYTLPNISLIPILSKAQSGEYTDTVGSTFLSTDGINFYKTVKVSLNALSTQKVYILWQPRWLAIPKYCQWTLLVSHDIIDTEGTCD